MTLYLDTSLLVAAYSLESKTDRVRTWLVEHFPEELSISDWVATEFSAALSVKLRTRQIDAPHRARALADFAGLRAHSLSTLPISDTHFRAAAGFADRYALGLRAGDALHLAICADHGATLCTLDRCLSEAGPALGVKTVTL